MDEGLFRGKLVESNRILYTASLFAKDNLIYLQEAGELYALSEHTSKREELKSYLFFIVLEGTGILEYDNVIYRMEKGYCAFIDCQKKYSHKTSSENLWHLKWIHFYGSTMPGIYDKYLDRGGVPCFRADEQIEYSTLLQEIYDISNQDSNVRDMLIFEKLTSLLTMVMIESRKGDIYITDASSIEAKLTDIKSYLDQHYIEKVPLDWLEEKFNINKYYLTRIFKTKFGISINSYLIQKRITKAKYLLRFTNQSIEAIGIDCGMSDASYFNKAFKKVEGISPREFRRLWSKL